MISATKAIVLHKIKYSDSKTIVHAYTLNFGRISLMINHSAKNKQTKIKNYLQPLAIIEIELYYKKSREIHTIKNVHNVHPFRSIPYDIKKTTQALFLAEILTKTLKEEVSDIDLFNFVSKAILFLDDMKHNSTLFHVKFMMQLTTHLGFAPTGNYTVEDVYFDLAEGCFKKQVPVHTLYMDKENSKAWYDLLLIPFEQLQDIKFNKNIKSSLLENVIRYYQLHLLNNKEINSYPILKNLFQ